MNASAPMLATLRGVGAAALLLLGVATHGQQPPIGAGVDYLDPSTRPRAARMPEPASFAEESTVSYTIFAPPTAGTVVTLRRFAGRRVALQLPPQWIDGALTREQVLNILDRADFLYETYMELTGGEPGGEGLLPIAFVDVGPYGGFGWIGAKGIEISSGQWQLDMLRRDLDINGYVVHEMGHNFDIVFGGQDYPGAHAWTYLMDAVMNGLMQGDAAEHIDNSLRTSGFASYLNDANANWETCVKGGSCVYNRESLWGGSGLRFVQLHGVPALREAHVYARNNNPGATGADAMETLRLKALATGAQSNLGCYQSAWKWYASAELETFMAQYGANPFCTDDDADGTTELGGDCNDASALVNPTGSETANGNDDDCNGIVDDLLVSEPANGDFESELTVSHPVRIRGTIDHFSDADSFALPLSSDVTMRYRFTPLPFFRGWLFFYLPSGDWQTYAYASAPNAATGEVPLAAGPRRFSVEMNSESTPGPYELILWERTRPWGTAMTPQTSATGAQLRAVTTGSFEQTPDAIHFRVHGIGFAGSAPYSADATFDWTAPAGSYSYRAIPVRDGIPVAKASPPVAFTIPEATLAAPAALTARYDGTGVAISWSAVSGATAYEVERSSGSGFATIATSASLTFHDSGVTAGTAYLYRVRARNDIAVSPYSNVDLAVAMTFADDPIVPRATVIRATHLSELRSAIAAARTTLGLASPSWSTPLTGVIRAAAVAELYASLNEIAPMSEAPTAGAPIRASDVQRLRDALR